MGRAHDEVTHLGWARVEGTGWHEVAFSVRRDALCYVTVERDAPGFPPALTIPLWDVVWVDEIGGGDAARVHVEFELRSGATMRAIWSRSFCGTVIDALASAPPRPLLSRTARAYVAVVAVIAFVAAGYVSALDNRIGRLDVAIPASDDGATTWLLIGTDSRAAVGASSRPEVYGSTEDVPGERADAVVLVQQGSDGRPTRIVSVPRDLVVYREGRGVDRLALTLLDGPSALVTSICRSLGVAVDHVAVIRFDGVRSLVHALGGIEIDVPRPALDRNTGLLVAGGTSRVDGETAIAFARSRHMEYFTDGEWHPDAASDLGRQDRQRQLLRAIADRVPSALVDPVAAHSVAWAASGALEVDRRADPGDLLALARAVASGGEEISLPHRLQPDAIPTAHLATEASVVLDELRVGADDGPPCPRALI